MAAGLGLLISIVVVIPMALMSSLFWRSYTDIWKVMAKSMDIITGYAGGIGWITIIGLAVIKLE